MLSPGDMQPFRLMIEDYELLERAGAFYGRKVELIEGMIVEVNLEMLPHTRLKNLLARRFNTVLESSKSQFEALVEPTIAFPPYSMPNPDLVVADTTTDARYLGLKHLAIVVEVGASRLRGDLDTKRVLYAERHVPEYWVVDVAGRQVHQFWTPTDGAFVDSRIVPLDGELRSATVPDLAIDGSGIL